MFAALFFERDPLGMKDLGPGLLAYLQDAGGFAAVTLVIWLVYRLVARFSPGRPEIEPEPRSVSRNLFGLALLGAALAYAVYGLFKLMEATSTTGAGPAGSELAGIFLAVGGGCALFAVVLPFATDLGRFRLRRIWALARLSFKEAIRRKILWVFLALLLVFLFASWFIQSNPSDQVRSYVQVVSIAMSVLLLLVAGLLAAFGIPTDMKQQTIHTILTKPVERFEIVIGRFLGYALLMTLVLAAMSAVSLIYVLRGVDPDAAKASLKAREAQYGDLEFEGTKDKNKAENVGREWGYRQYITAAKPQEPQQFAVWKFHDVRDLADRKAVRCEYGFDIYRTTKGTINQGVFCTFIVQSWRFDPARKQEYDNERRRRNAANDPDADEDLASKYGYFEFPAKDVGRGNFYIDVPSGIFKHALGTDEALSQELAQRQITRAPVELRVRCETRTQYVGMAKYDLYFRADDHTGAHDRARFIWNFAKGQVGLWFRLCFVIGLAVATSTYLSGLISFLLTAALYLGGIFKESIRVLARGESVVGGPFVSSYNLALRNTAGVQDITTSYRVVEFSDEVILWQFRLVLRILPDVDRFDLTDYVAEGFNIPGGQLLITGLMVAGYLAACALAAYFLIKVREIASTM
jgi:hypothetical protein